MSSNWQLEVKCVILRLKYLLLTKELETKYEQNTGNMDTYKCSYKV